MEYFKVLEIKGYARFMAGYFDICSKFCIGDIPAME